MNKTIVASVALALIALVGISAVTAFPGMRAGLGDLSDDDLAKLQEHHDAVRQAIEDEDYAAWKSAMESQITQERFDALVEHHARMQVFHEAMEEARDSGDYAAMQDLRQQYGVGQGRGMHKTGWGN